MLIEILQVATTTTTGGQFDTSLVALVALIFGIVATALSIPLAIITIREYFSRRSRATLTVLAPKLREMRALLSKGYGVLDIESACHMWWREILDKGYERRLKKIEGLPQRDFQRRLDHVFPDLYTRTLTVKKSHKDIISFDDEAVRLKHDVIAAIDRILEKVEV